MKRIAVTVFLVALASWLPVLVCNFNLLFSLSLFLFVFLIMYLLQCRVGGGVLSGLAQNLLVLDHCLEESFSFWLVYN